MPIATAKWYTKQLLLTHKDKYFVFGDNSLKRGLGGQAKVCRGHPNVIGIVTKKYPSNLYESYYYEIELELWLKEAASGFYRVEHELKKGKTVVWPEDGIGTGLAQLPQKAPSINNYIENFLKRMKETYGENHLS